MRCAVLENLNQLKINEKSDCAAARVQELSPTTKRPKKYTITSHNSTTVSSVTT